MAIKMKATVAKKIPAEKAAISPFNLSGYLTLSEINAPSMKEDATVKVIRNVRSGSCVRLNSSPRSINFT